MCSVVQRLLENYLSRPSISFLGVSYSTVSADSKPGVLQRVSSAAGRLISLALALVFCANFDILFQVHLFELHLCYLYVNSFFF